MDVSKLQNLIQLLRSSGILYYKDTEVELILEQNKTQVIAAPQISTPEPELPDVMKRLNPNYSHPSLMRMVKPHE